MSACASARGALDAVEGEAERDIVARGPPGQQGVVLEQNADLGRAQAPVSIRAGKRLLQADHARAAGSTCRSPKARPGSRTGLHRPRCSPVREPARRRRRSSSRETRRAQPPTIVVSCSPAMLASGLSRPPTIRLWATRLAASRSMVTALRIELVAIATEDFAELLEVEPGGHLLGERARRADRRSWCAAS